MFLWPDPGDYSPPDVIRHRALWSADFPQPNSKVWIWVFDWTGEPILSPLRNPLSTIGCDHLSDLGQCDITMKPFKGLDKIYPLV